MSSRSRAEAAHRASQLGEIAALAGYERAACPYGNGRWSLRPAWMNGYDIGLGQRIDREIHQARLRAMGVKA